MRATLLLHVYNNNIFRLVLISIATDQSERTRIIFNQLLQNI